MITQIATTTTTNSLIDGQCSWSLFFNSPLNLFVFVFKLILITFFFFSFIFFALFCTHITKKNKSTETNRIKIRIQETLNKKNVKFTYQQSLDPVCFLFSIFFFFLLLGDEILTKFNVRSTKKSNFLSFSLCLCFTRSYSVVRCRCEFNNDGLFFFRKRFKCQNTI